MTESDSDFSDFGDTDVDEELMVEAPRVNKNGVKIRGRDKSWEEHYKFSSAAQFQSSEICKVLKKEFSKRKSREYEYGDVDEYECKYSI